MHDGGFRGQGVDVRGANVRSRGGRLEVVMLPVATVERVTERVSVSQLSSCLSVAMVASIHDRHSTAQHDVSNNLTAVLAAKGRIATVIISGVEFFVIKWLV